MTTSDYTRKQRDAINRAWSYLTDMADRVDWSTPAKLKRIETYERGQRSCQLAARALIVEAVTDGLANPDMPLIEHADESDGLVLAYSLGAKIGRHNPHVIDQKWHGIAHACKEAHASALQSRLEKI